MTEKEQSVIEKKKNNSENRGGGREYVPCVQEECYEIQAVLSSSLREYCVKCSKEI